MDLIKRIAAYFIVFAMVIGSPVFMGALPESMQGNGSRVYASGTLSNLDVQFTGDISGVQGDKVTVAFTVKNTGDAAYTVEGAEAVFNSKDITVTNGGNAQTILASKGDSAILSFNASIAKNAETGSFNCFLKTKNGESANFQFTVSENLATPDSNKGNYVGSADISHTVTPSSGFAAGDGNKISFDIHNNGNTIIKNAKATVTLPENISVYNSSNSVDLGYISTGQRKNATFEISVADTIESKNYPITLSITGLSYSNTEVKIEKTFYVPVAGGGATSSTKNMSILNISVPGTVTADKDFNMSFSVKNTGTTTAKNLKVFVEMPEGLLNKTTTTFVENSIAAGETKTYSVTMFSSVGGTTYPIK
ncbi:MAG: CARDB domain-containing protein, partial [Anaerovorax sp.]